MKEGNQKEDQKSCPPQKRRPRFSLKQKRKENEKKGARLTSTSRKKAKGTWDAVSRSPRKDVAERRELEEVLRKRIRIL